MEDHCNLVNEFLIGVDTEENRGAPTVLYQNDGPARQVMRL